MCIYNQYIKNRKYVKNKTNKGIIPNLPDVRVEYVPTKCGNCIECRKQYAREWLVRLLEHIKTNKNGKFITLTFSNEAIKELLNEKNTIKRTDRKTGEIRKLTLSSLSGYDKDNTIATLAVRRFTNRWKERFGTAPKHWLITELGHNGTENIHLHGIIWTNEPMTTIREVWKYGYVWPRPETQQQTYVNEKTIKYITKYIFKKDQRNKEYKSKVLASQNIGINYINTLNAKTNQFKNRETDQTFTTTTGHKMALPTYYKKKIYTEIEREQLWLNLLDKQERWVLGKKVDISKDDKEYKRAVIEARKLNTELGYGGLPNENRKKYEEQRRNIMLQTRLNKIAKQNNTNEQN